MQKCRAFDGTPVDRFLPRMPCGGIPEFDVASGYAYRCTECLAVIGSMGQPKRCVTINNETDEGLKDD